jgi:predicted metalloprotease with PDZ domain
MKYILILFCFLSFAIFAQTKADFSYDIKLQSDGTNKGCEVTLTYHSKNTRNSTFSLPQIWGAESSLDFIQVKKIKGAKQVKLKNDDLNLNLKHKENATIKLTYFVKSLVKDSIYHHQEEFLPNVQENYFVLFTNSIFIVLADSTDQLYSYDINWLNYPSTYKNKPQTSFGDGLKQTLNYEKISDFQNAVMVGGDFKTIAYSDPEKNRKIRYIYRSSWDFDPQVMAKLVISTFKFQQSFWNDYSTKEYSVFMSPAYAENEFEMSYNGTGLCNSFNVVATNNRNTNPENMGYLFNHELMHHWIGNTILNGVDEELSYWFSEGFTDYFTFYNMKESKLITEKEYYFRMDSVFIAHYGNDLNSAINDSIKPNFWKRGYYGKLPYNRGNIFAYYLDNLLQSKTNGKVKLVNVMQKMMEQALVKKRPFDKVWLNETVKELAGFEILDLIERYIMKGETISVDEFNKVLNHKVELQQAKVYDVGFETEKNSAGKTIIASVKINSGAQKAGVEVGQVVEGYSIYGSAGALSELYILTENGSKKIEFYPYILKELPQHIKE